LKTLSMSLVLAGVSSSLVLMGGGKPCPRGGSHRESPAK